MVYTTLYFRVVRVEMPIFLCPKRDCSQHVLLYCKLNYLSGLKIGPLQSSEMTNNRGRTSSVSLSFSYRTSAPAWQL